jgi:hypothetical protein
MEFENYFKNIHSNICGIKKCDYIFHIAGLLYVHIF